MKELLQRYVPAASVAYCLELWERHQFHFTVTRPRRTRLGDFCAKPGELERITVNGNLNPCNFLITYLHEIAHLQVHRNYRRRQPSHGAAWKKHFRNLLAPVLTEAHFPSSVLLPLIDYARNPKAATVSHLPLMLALRALDAPAEAAPTTPAGTMVRDLREGEVFRLNSKVFIKGELRRTRVLCVEKSSQRRYTVAAHALVEILNG